MSTLHQVVISKALEPSEEPREELAVTCQLAATCPRIRVRSLLYDRLEDQDDRRVNGPKLSQAVSMASDQLARWFPKSMSQPQQQKDSKSSAHGGDKGSSDAPQQQKSQRWKGKDGRHKEGKNSKS